MNKQNEKKLEVYSEKLGKMIEVDILESTDASSTNSVSAGSVMLVVDQD
jgi:hypothetical protein